MRTITFIFILGFISSRIFAVAPVASSVNITGVNHVGATLTGNYTFSDGDGHTESGSTYKWYRGNNADGSDKVAISGATSKTYTLVVADYNKYIFFEVTPRDNNGETGSAVVSTATPKIKDYDDLTYNNNSTLNVSGTLNVGTLTANNNLTINVGASDSLIVWLNLIANNNVTVNVTTGGVFLIKGDLDLNNGPTISISGVLSVQGDIDVEQNATITVASGGNLNVTGDFTSGANGDINIEGSVSIGGDMNVGNNSSIDVDMNNDGNGSLSIGGNLTGGTGVTVNGYGPVNVGGTVTPAGLASDSQINGPLPISLNHFSATPAKNAVILTWVTASEFNNHYFTLEKSTDGKHFIAETIVQGAGNSNTEIRYTYTDHRPLSSVMYYRLRQTDFDGTTSTSKIVIARITLIDDNVFYIGPNPVNKTESLTIQYSQTLSGNTTLSLLDLKGTIISSKEIFAENTGQIVFELPLNIQPGIYMLRISGMIEASKKIIVK